MEPTDSDGYILGFDPGGYSPCAKGYRRQVCTKEGHFGWSVCCVVDGILQPRATTGLAKDAWDAVAKVKDAMTASPIVLAAGIDAPLFWSKRANRAVDCKIKKALRAIKAPTKSVLEVNSLSSAATVQGMLLTKYLRAAWVGVNITECHPFALRRLLVSTEQAEILRTIRCLTAHLDTDVRPDDAHKRDATLSAVSAWAAKYRNEPGSGWRNLYDEEPHTIQPFNVDVSYWMPIPSD